MFLLTLGSQSYVLIFLLEPGPTLPQKTKMPVKQRKRVNESAHGVFYDWYTDILMRLQRALLLLKYHKSLSC